MIVLPELWSFLKYINSYGIEKAKKTYQYRILINVYKNNYNVGIPFWSLFENEDLIDLILYEKTNISMVYDKNLKSFMFCNISQAILGISDIFHNLQDFECYSILQNVIKYLSTSDEDILCNAFDTMKI